MKLKIIKNGKKEELEVDFWSSFAISVLSYLTFSGMLILMLLLMNILFYL
jgi:hypothetical protein